MQSHLGTDPTGPFDYIIVGAGVAGCTLAAQIAARNLGSVLLLDAGDSDRSYRLRVPAEYPTAFGTSWDWSFRTTPQAGLGNRSIPLPAGRALGGSSAINAMIYIEASASDFGEWAKAAGERWSELHCREAFRQVRNWIGKLTRTIPTQLMSQHNSAFNASPPAIPELHPTIQQAWQRLHTQNQTASSYPHGLDRPHAGFDAYLRMQQNGRRISAWKLLQLALQATTPKGSHPFSCLHAAHVRSVEFDRDRAVGVRIMNHGEERVIQAHRGVILSAGTFGTPRILFASGIGARDELQAIDVPHRLESPCLGKNLQDHLVLPMVYRLNGGTAVSYPPSREDRLTYLRNRTGPRASNLAELGGFFNSSADTASIASSREPFDFQWHITPTHYLEYPNLVSHTPHLSFGLTHVAPKSRGFVKPRRASDSIDHEIALHIDPGYMSDPGDLLGWFQGISRTRELLQGDGWCDWLAEETLPGARRSDAKVLELFVRRFATTIYHYAGTCSLGMNSLAALDEQFRVRGIDGLWVCDASAMPTLVRCNPQATIMMMAWRLADWLP